MRDDISRLQDILNSIAISQELKQQNAHIPWRAISDMRNVLAHQYFEVDHEKIELVVHGSLEDLKSTVIKILGGDSNCC